MAPSFLGYFGLGSPPPAVEEKSPVRALPGSWYTSREMYELERRAIFSRRWLLATHKSRFTKAGDWIKYDIAGFQIIICRDRSGKINAFHNICRHRAYPVVEGENGTAKIFSCRYHGWSYGLNGSLAKAPGYQDLGGFDKSKNGMLPVHVHLDHSGFVWINMDAKATPEVAWDDDFEGIDTQERFNIYNFEDYVFDHSWDMQGAYNWKILSDNYNECYHCATTHPDIPDVADLNSYSVNTNKGYIQHNAATTEVQKQRGLIIAAQYYFPNASMNVSPHFFFIQRFVPHGPTSSSMRYEVYRNKHSSEEDFQLVNQMYKRIMSEDKFLCEAAQRNINAGVFINGEMHPKMEKGPLFFQKSCRDAVVAHHKKEQVAKREIWPARQQLPEQAKIALDDVEFCSGLACQPANQEVLAW